MKSSRSSKKSKKKNRKIRFVKKTHEYFVDGVKVPSVSEIMKPISEGFYQRIPKRNLEIARDRGIAVHEAIENFVLFDIVSDTYKEYVDLFMLFLSENDLHVDKSEFMLTDGKYAGTIDLLVRTAENELILVDIKVTNKINYPLVRVQLGGYRDLLHENGYNIRSCHVLHLKKNKYVYEQIEPDDEKWKGLLNEYENKVHTNKSGD